MGDVFKNEKLQFEEELTNQGGDDFYDFFLLTGEYFNEKGCYSSILITKSTTFKESIRTISREPRIRVRWH